jgi:hypothetical protein
MTTQEVKRKLTAILSADVKGYSRLMGEDEVGTIRTLNAYKEVMAGPQWPDLLRTICGTSEENVIDTGILIVAEGYRRKKGLTNYSNMVILNLKRQTYDQEVKQCPLLPYHLKGSW